VANLKILEDKQAKEKLLHLLQQVLLTLVELFFYFLSYCLKFKGKTPKAFCLMINYYFISEPS
jgi:hypothetical protein